MFLLKANRQKRTVLVLIILVTILTLLGQLTKFEYDGIAIPDLSWPGEDSESAASTSSIKHEPQADEKYITYLPYSRFSNQRGTLLNAALLAKYLNRTLIVPPMFLGAGTGWSPDPGLYNVLANMTDPKFQEQCFDDAGAPVQESIVFNSDNVPEFGCYNFTNYVTLPWSWITDLNRLTHDEQDGGLGIRIVERTDMSLAGLQHQLNLSEEDIYLMHDTTRYQWHIYEGTEVPPHNTKYDNEISINQLSEFPQKVIHFYGIFGYDRLWLTSRESEEYKLRINQALLVRHEAITKASTIILNQLLKGVGKSMDQLVPLDPIQAKSMNDNQVAPRFIAAHIRAGDGVFLANLKNRVPEFVHQVWDIMTMQEMTHDDLVGPSNNPNLVITPTHKLYPMPRAPRRIREYLREFDVPTRLDECAKLEQTVLYVATDAPNPRENVELQPILDAFPCTFFMQDFPMDWKQYLSSLRSSLDKHKSMTDYLVMFVDATICAWAERFVGTRTSTFSSYIKEFRHALFDEIVESGRLDV